jgi:hypothetical protein
MFNPEDPAKLIKLTFVELLSRVSRKVKFSWP